MEKTIICPTDFSDTANNATEYAAKLAQIIDAELVLVNVQKILAPLAAVSLNEGVGRNTRENTLLASNKLKEMSREINKIFKISATYEVDISTRSLAKTISDYEKKNSLIVMGTNGADNLTQFFGGTNTYNVIKQTKCPVLIVPENFPFGSYKNILYPISEEKINRLALNQFNDFIKYFDAQLTFLYVSKENTESSARTFNTLKEDVEIFFGEKFKLNFKKIFSENIDDAIDDYVVDNATDLLVMEMHPRSLLEKVFKKKPILATLSAIASYPIFVVHS